MRPPRVAFSHLTVHAVAGRVKKMPVIGCQNGAVPASNTERAYRSDWTDFCAWCTRRRRRPLPATTRTVIEYITDLARTRRPSTVRRRLAAIQARHVEHGFDGPRLHPAVRLAAVRADWRGREQRRPTAPLLARDLRRCCACLPDTLAGRRDRAVLLVAYGAALRRTELVGLDAGDVCVGADGALRVCISRGPVRVPPGSSDLTCAVRAWERWRTAAGSALDGGPAFRPIDRHGNLSSTRLSDRAVTTIVQRAARTAGLTRPERYTGRSLRLGMILAAAEGGTPVEGIMAHTGHRSKRLVSAYRRDG
jgi:site-specific recombinase XerD